MSLLMTHPAIPTYIYCYLGELGCLVFWLGPRLLLLSFQSFAFNSTLLTQKGGFFFSCTCLLSDHITAFAGLPGASSLSTRAGAFQASQFGCGGLPSFPVWQQTRHGSFFNKRMFRKRRSLSLHVVCIAEQHRQYNFLYGFFHLLYHFFQLWMAEKIPFYCLFLHIFTGIQFSWDLLVWLVCLQWQQKNYGGVCWQRLVPEPERAEEKEQSANSRRIWTVDRGSEKVTPHRFYFSAAHIVCL